MDHFDSGALRHFTSSVPLPWRYLLAASLALALMFAGCATSSQGAEPCGISGPCSAGRTCVAGLCVPEDASTPDARVSDADAAPTADAGDAGCQLNSCGGATPYCETISGMCVACLDDADCAADGYECTDEACTYGNCTHPIRPGACDDGVACTHGDACDGSGVCAGTSYTCTPAECEASSVCDGLGGCTVLDEAVHTLCDDGVACTRGDECDGSGVCVGTGYTCAPGECDVSSVCDGSGGCTVVHEAEGTLCSDGVACTHGDECNNAGDCHGTSYTCAPGECEASSVCDGLGGCTVEPKAEHADCNDGLDCTDDECNADGACLGFSTCGTSGTCTATGCEPIA